MLAIGWPHATHDYLHCIAEFLFLKKTSEKYASVGWHTLLLLREAKRNMKIDNELVERLAELARLEFDEEEKQRIICDLQKIFDLVEKLNEVNVEGVEPLIYMSEEVNVFREDEIQGQISKSDALKNAPHKDSDYFKVPKVIKK